MNIRAYLKIAHSITGSISCSMLIFGAASLAAQTVDLPTSKQLIGEIPGHPQRLNSLPMTMAVSPDGRYVVTVNAGYGTFESKYEQSLAVLDTQTGALEDFPDDRTGDGAKQTLYSGLAFGRDGRHLYASMGSVTLPEGDGKKATGSGVVVYSFNAGKIAPERFIPLPLQQLAAGRKTKLIGGVEGDKGVPFPADLAVVGPQDGRNEKLLVADNLSDDVLLLDPATGKIEKRFDLSESDAVPSTLSHCAGGAAVWRTGVCGAVECLGDRRTGFGRREGGAQAHSVEADQPHRARNAPVRVSVFARQQDALCRARQP